MKKILIAFFLLIICIAGFAQPSGYQGKRLSLNYNFMFMSSLTSPNQNGQKDIFSFNSHNRIGVDYVLTRKLAMGGDFHFFKTMFEFPSFDYSYNYGYSGGYFHTGNYGNLAVKGVGVHLKQFYGRESAPLGNYIEYEILEMIATASFDKSRLAADNPGMPEIQNLSPYSSLALGLTFGKQRIYFNRVILNLGLQGGFVFKGLGLSADWDSQYHTLDYSYLEDATFSRAFRHFLFNIRIGASFLAL